MFLFKQKTTLGVCRLLQHHDESWVWFVFQNIPVAMGGQTGRRRLEVTGVPWEDSVSYSPPQSTLPRPLAFAQAVCVPKITLTPPRLEFTYSLRARSNVISSKLFLISRQVISSPLRAPLGRAPVPAGALHPSCPALRLPRQAFNPQRALTKRQRPAVLSLSPAANSVRAAQPIFQPLYLHGA